MAVLSFLMRAASQCAAALPLLSDTVGDVHGPGFTGNARPVPEHTSFGGAFDSFVTPSRTRGLPSAAR